MSVLREIYQLLRDTFVAWDADKAPRLGAALAYYSIFSLAPILVIAVGMASLVFGEEAARSGVVREIGTTMGEPAAEAIQQMVTHSEDSGGNWLATIMGLALLIFGASGVFLQLQDALNTIWKVTPRPDRGIWGMIRERFLSFAVVLGTGFLLLTSLAISALLAAVGDYLSSGVLPGGPMLWQGINMLVSLSFITLLFALIYKLLPDATVAWRDVWVGAAFTAVLFTLGKYLIGLYLGQSSVTSAFGAAGSVVVILVWVYYSSQILLFGAEFTRVYANRYGSQVVPTPNAVALTPETQVQQGLKVNRHLPAPGTTSPQRQEVQA